MILLLENFIRGGINSVTGDRYVKSDEIKKMYFDAKNLYGHSSLNYYHMMELNLLEMLN